MEGTSALASALRSSTRKTMGRLIDRKNVPNLAHDGDPQHSYPEIIAMWCLSFMQFCFTLFVLVWETQDIRVTGMRTQLDISFKMLMHSGETYQFRTALRCK